MNKLSKAEWAVLSLTILFFAACLAYFAWQNRPQPLPLVFVETQGKQAISQAAVPEAPGILDGERININTASAEDLTRLPGIGEKRAADIVTYRTQHGPFTGIERIVDVSGIGEATFLKIADYICVTGD